jgi:hypothetical protein
MERLKMGEKDFINKNDRAISLLKDEDYQQLFKVIFQILTAIYALSLMKTNHNDLHGGNIYVQILDHEENIIYYINTKKYSIKSKYRIFIYDYDRSFCSQLGNNSFLMDPFFCKEFFSCNTFYEQLDFIKILCYLFRDHAIPETIQDKIIECIIDSESITPEGERKIKEILKKSYKQDKENDCFFQNIQNKNRKSFMTSCRNLDEIIEKVFHLIVRDEIFDKDMIKHVYVCNRNNFYENGVLDIVKQKEEFDKFYNAKKIWSNRKIKFIRL